MDSFESRVEQATGLSYNDTLILAEAQDAERQRRIRIAGYCCEAGAVAFPNHCPWH